MLLSVCHKISILVWSSCCRVVCVCVCVCWWTCVTPNRCLRARRSYFGNSCWLLQLMRRRNRHNAQSTPTIECHSCNKYTNEHRPNSKHFDSFGWTSVLLCRVCWQWIWCCQEYLLGLLEMETTTTADLDRLAEQYGTRTLYTHQTTCFYFHKWVERTAARTSELFRLT